jgi:hypothetical protein
VSQVIADTVFTSSPPRGRFSHLTMFRIGSVFFIPAYLCVILFRPLASAQGDDSFLLMAGKVQSQVLSASHAEIFRHQVSLLACKSRGSSLSAVRLMFSLRLLRYVGITFGYTAISILLNYSMLFFISTFLDTHSPAVTPPAAVGMANGIAQSIVSLARCFGPILGGYVSPFRPFVTVRSETDTTFLALVRQHRR